MRLAALFLALLWPFTLSAQETIVADLSQSRVAITTNFTGSEILIFGAVKREKPRESLGNLDVIITVAGPAGPVTVRRKARWGPIWINRAEVEIDSAPSFYAVLSTKPLDVILSDTEDLRHQITRARAIRSVGADAEVGNPVEFTDALIRIRETSGSYQLIDDGVTLLDETLFRASVSLPANLVEGEYKTEMYLVRDQEVVSKYTASIAVQKVGLERFLYNMAHNQPLLYGLMSLFIAIAAGWLASAAFRLIKA